MTKKNINNAELDFIRLEAQDVLTGPSNPGLNPGDSGNGGDDAAPSRFFGGSDFNYRGVEKGYEDEEW